MSSTCQSDHLGRLLGQCQHRMRMVMDRSLRQYGVTPVQCRALMYLHRQPEPVTQRQLEQYMAVKPSTINGIVGRLEEKGLLTRDACQQDARCRVLRLTEEGRRFRSDFIRIEDQPADGTGLLPGGAGHPAPLSGTGGAKSRNANGGNRTMIRKLAPYTKGYRVYILLGILCSAGEAVLELMLPKAMSSIVDYGIGGNGGAGDRSYILTMGLKMVLMALICLALGVGAAALAAKAGMGFGANVRDAEYRQVQRFSFSNIEHFSTASLITRLTNDVSSVQMTLMMGMRMLVRAPVMLITALVMALRISLQLSQIFLVILPLLALMVFIILRYVGPFFTSLQKATDGLNLVVQEDLNAIRVVKSFVREDREKEKFFQRSETLRQTAERAFGFVVTFIPMVNLIMGGTIVSIMWLGGHYVAGGQMLSGDLLAFFTYASEILMALMMVAMVMMVLTRSIACGKRIVEVLEEQPEITDDDAVKEIADDGTERELTLSDGSIRFDHVYFKYHPDSAEWNLTDIDFSIASGMTVGILGGTGSAKSTLVSLIPRLYEATEGAVYVGGHNVKDYTMETLREGCAMVLQKNTLFSGTIRDNLRWGDENATDQEMETACRMACADEFISRMPDGYDTRIEQGGTNVSGGQKQRLCIARAILRKPKVLILDDSTSAVDTATDAKIRAALKEALPGSTKLIIAQRISSVMDADVILVLDDGKISGMGTHEQLMASNQIYREVYQSQQEGVSIDG